MLFLCKTFEKGIKKTILIFINNYNKLSCDRFSFGKGKLTMDAFVRLFNVVVEECANKKHTVGVFFDLSKAIDSVEH